MLIWVGEYFVVKNFFQFLVHYVEQGQPLKQNATHDFINYQLLYIKEQSIYLFFSFSKLVSLSSLYSLSTFN